MHRFVHRTALLTGLTLAAACADGPTQPEFAPDLARNAKTGKGGQGNAGTTLIASKTATGFHERRTEYDWTLEKRVTEILGDNMVREASTSTTFLPAKTTKWIHYQIVATRSESPTVATNTGVRGEVCVENGGHRPTEGLAILDVVQRKDGGRYLDHASASVDVSAKPILGPGEQHCYPYEVLFPGTAGGQYRNTAFVTITNHSGHLGTPFGPAANGGGVKADFSVPASASSVTVDASAHVWDGMSARNMKMWYTGTCAAIWPLIQCTSENDDGDWHFTQTATIEFMVDIANMYACGRTLTFRNDAVLTESGSGTAGATPDRREASASFTITTPDCPPPDACPRAAADWRDGQGWPPHVFWSDRVQDAPFFDSGENWLTMLRSEPGNSYRALAHEYIATTLNLMNRAPVPGHVQDSRLEVAGYFASSPEVRARVSTSQLAEWTAVLRSYNESGCS